MQYLSLCIYINLAIFFGFLPPSVSLAQNDEVPTFYFDLGAGFTTYKSQVVESNDTSFTVGYKLGFYGGEEKTLGVNIQSDSSTTNFQYADSTEKSKIVTSFQSTTLKYRWGPAYVGLIFDLASLAVTKRDAEFIDALGSGYGANLGFILPIGRQNRIFLDISQTTTSTLKEVLQSGQGSNVSIGNRTDIQLGGIIKLTRKLLDLQIGYRQRSYGVTVADQSYLEVQTMMWLGFGMNWSF